MRNVSLINYSFKNLVVERNAFSGARGVFVSTGNGEGKKIIRNTFTDSGSRLVSPISGCSIGMSMIENSFVESRSSDVPLKVLDLFVFGSNSRRTLNFEILGNSVSALSALYGSFFEMSGGGGAYGVTGLKVARNKISGCVKGIVMSSGGAYPNSSDVDIYDNDFRGCEGEAVIAYRIEKLRISNNIFNNVASNTAAIELTQCSRYTAQSNQVFDSRSGTARCLYAIRAMYSPAKTSAVLNNVSYGVQSGYSVATAEADTANNCSY